MFDFTLGLEAIQPVVLGYLSSFILRSVIYFKFNFFLQGERDGFNFILLYLEIQFPENSVLKWLSFSPVPFDICVKTQVGIAVLLWFWVIYYIFL